MNINKFLLFTGMVLITNVANAQTEYYTSVKVGAGDTTIYVNNDDKFGDYLVKVSEENSGNKGYTYDDNGLLWELSAAVGIDWSPNELYVKQNPYSWFHLRLEGEFGYNNYRESGKLRYNYTVTDEIKIKYDHLFAIANGYADFRIDKVVPYIGLGVGYSFGNEELKLNNNFGESGDSADDSGFIYALYLGVGYKYSDITTFDLGVRRVYAPAKHDGLDIFDTIRLGTRFRI